MAWLYYDPRQVRVSRPKKRWSLKCDGKSVYVLLNEGIIDVSKPFAVEVWFRYRGAVYRDPTLVEFYRDGSNRIRFVIRNGNEAINEAKTPLTYDRFLWDRIKYVEDGNVHQFLAVVNPHGTSYQYIDGELQFTRGPRGAKWFSLSNPVRMTVAYPAYFCHWWYGEILQVRVYYDVCLGAGEVKHNFENPLNPVRRGLALWWAFEEGTGNTVYDLSGNGRHGTIHGNYEWVTLP